MSEACSNGFLNLVNPKFKNFNRPMLLALPVVIVGLAAFFYQIGKTINTPLTSRFIETKGNCHKPGRVPDAPTKLSAFECVGIYKVDVGDTSYDCIYDPALIGGDAEDVDACPDSYYQVDPVVGDPIIAFPKDTTGPPLPTSSCVNLGDADCTYMGVTPRDLSGEISVAFAFLGTVETLFTICWISALWFGGCIKSTDGKSFKDAVTVAVKEEEENA
jgi:hypothetical protein